MHCYYNNAKIQSFYNVMSLENILLFNTVERKFRITTDTDLDPAINLYMNDDTSIVLKCCNRGLYYYEKTNMEYNTINRYVSD